MAPENALLSLLPPAAKSQLDARLESVPLTRGQRLFEPGEAVKHLVFPCDALISLELSTSEGVTIQVMTVGAEGMTDVSVVFGAATSPYAAVVQEPGRGFRIRPGVLATERQRLPALDRALERYMAESFRVVAQAVVCHHAHSVLERLCRVILVASDRVGEDVIHMTHQALGRALGSDRSVVSRAMSELHDADAIQSRGGRIRIRKRGMIEATTCECYRALRQPLRVM